MRAIVKLAASLALLTSVGFSMLASGSDAPLGLDIHRPTPPDNPLTPAKIALGRRLFQDRRLSRDGTLACESCHERSRAFTDGRVVAVGIGGLAGRRNAPTLVNRAYGTSFFWDGRAASLEQQVVQPLLDPREMATTPDAVLAILRRDASYRRQFVAAFAREPQWDDVARALAGYVRTIRSGDSRYDRFRFGATSALTMQEQRGMRLFLGKANCWSCHSGPNLSDERFHNTGVAFRGEEFLDAGRFAASQKPVDRGAFKTPTLREVARTAPYMHDGSIATLDAVVDYYDRGGNANSGLDRLILPLRLSMEEKRDLVAFLLSLSGRISEGR
jgi:cytochrome c peroxidase